jgi:hypothetical protein
MIKLVKVGNSDDDNFKSNLEYNLIPIGRPILGRSMWYHKPDNKNVLYFTEPICKVGFNYFKTKKCKYLVENV